MKYKEKLIDHMFNSACGYGMAESNGIQSPFDLNGNYLPEHGFPKILFESLTLSCAAWIKLKHKPRC